MRTSTASSVVADSCRLTIISSTRRIDLAVPAQLSVAELLSIVVTALGPDAADTGVTEGGWILQPAGADALSPARTLATSGIVDGDVLHLRTRANKLPELAFDDVIDAVADGVRNHTQRWTPAHTARCVTIFAGALLILTAMSALSAGPRWVATSVTLGAGTVVLGLIAVSLDRVLHRRGPALTAAGSAIAYGVGCGASAVGGHQRLVDFGARELLAGFGVGLLAAIVLLIVLSDGVAGLVAAAVSAMLGVVGTSVAFGFDLPPGAGAGVVAAVALACFPLLPTLALRLSRLPLPAVSLDDADGRDDDTLDARHVRCRAVRADQYLTGLIGGGALAVGAAAATLAGRGVAAEALAVVLALSCLLRARLFTGRGQRTVLLTSGGVGLVAEYAAVVIDTHGTVSLLAVAVPAGILGLLLLGSTATLPGRRYAPTVTRAVDILESLLVLSVIPLALGVMGVYGALGHLTG